MRTFTAYKLTDHMLQRLSAIVNGHKHKCGTSLNALERRKLIEERTAPDGEGGYTKWKYHATAKGEAALEAARLEGW